MQQRWGGAGNALHHEGMNHCSAENKKVSRGESLFFNSSMPTFLAVSIF